MPRMDRPRRNGWILLAALALTPGVGAAAPTRPAGASPVTAPSPASAPATAPAPAPMPVGAVSADEARREIAALLSLLRVSPCRFERNGRWYDGERASAHLQRKLDYAVARGLPVGTTEQFIDTAATRSSLTGRAYAVQCGEAAPVPAAAWFRARLAELRD